MVTMDYVELHFHLLPGVDDGPTTVEESIALARAALSDGTRTIVATPHVHAELFTDPAEVSEHTRQLNEHLGRAQLPVRVLPGGELDHTLVGELSQRQLELIAQGPAGRRWLLLEAPFSGIREDFEAAADELRDRGFGVLVAHPERARPTPESAAILEREIALGSALQLTAGSLTGGFGARPREEALRLLSVAPRAVVSSDAHGPSRMPALTPALHALARLGVHDPDRYVAHNPRSLIARGLDVWPSASVA
jgi:protein-tyrosine phosphatase